MPSTDSEQNIKRRRILKAAASAPVIFTLPSGAALAAGSLTCAAKSLERATGETVDGVTVAPDAWMRFSVPGLRLRFTGNRVVDGFRLDGSLYQVVGSDVVLISETPVNEASNGQTYFLLVDYEAYSDPIVSPDDPASYVYLGTPTANPIAGASCWNSLNSTDLQSNVIN